MKTRIKQMCLMSVLLTGLLCVGESSAAVIGWSGSALRTNGISTIETSGTLVQAINYGGPELSAGGITFEAGAGQNALSGTYKPYIDEASFTGDSDFDAILNTGTWEQYPSGGASTITITNLTAGSTYLVQLFAVDTRDAYSGVDDRSITVDGAITSGEMNDGFVFTGTFLADASSQDIAMTGSHNNWGLANAYQLRSIDKAIPEPATLTYIGLFGGGVLFVRRFFLMG